jgi:hypothetical protein
MQKKLDVAASVAIIVVAVLLGVTLIRQHLFRKNSANTASETALEAPLQPGRHLDAPAGYQWQTHPRTLLFALRYGCIHCEHNMAFYQKLQHLVLDKAPNTYMLSVFPDESFIAQHDLDAHNLHGMPFLATVSFRNLHVFGTPTLLLVDSQGTILHSWVGELSEKQQNEVTQAIQGNS